MKNYTNIKVGYSSGSYGCSGEYYELIYTTKTGLKYIAYGGLYGADERIKRVIEKKGYKPSYCQSQYGKINQKDTKWFISETEALEFIKKL